MERRMERRRSRQKAFSMKSFFMAFALLLCVIFPAFQVEAASKAPTCAKKQTVYVYNYNANGNDWAATMATGCIYIKNLASNAKITNIKSSNKSMKAFYWKDYDIDGVTIDAAKRSYEGNNTLRPGQKSKISFTVKQNGKKYKLSCTVTTKKMPSPVKTLKIGGKEYASTCKGSVYPSVPLEEVQKLGSRVKVTYKSASGFKVDGVTALYYTKGSNPKIVKVKNGSKISTKNLSSISISYHVTKKVPNYKEPGSWGGITGSPLKDYCTISFFKNAY